MLHVGGVYGANNVHSIGGSFWLFLSWSGHDAAAIYMRMLNGAIGSKYNLSETVVAIPLMLAGLAVSPAFRMKLWNIGAEGQLYMGAFAASGIALAWGDMSSWVLLPLMLLAGFAAGAVWGGIPGFLRAYWQVNETITTLMLNYVAIFWVSYLVFGPWKDPAGMGFPLSARFSLNAYLPVLGTTRVHLGLIIAIIIALLLYVILNYTRWGYEIRISGESQEAARYAGINVTRNIILVMLISGGIAGITGMIEVSGITHRLQQEYPVMDTPIIVAWLARLNPFAIILVAFLVRCWWVVLDSDHGNILFDCADIAGAVLFFLLAANFSGNIVLS